MMPYRAQEPQTLWHKTTLLLAMLSLAGLMGCIANAQQYVGFREDFSSSAGWQPTGYGSTTGMASITSDGGQTTFATLNGSFGMTSNIPAARSDWDVDQQGQRDAAYGEGIIAKRYPVQVDLSRYHYLVVRMTYSGTWMGLAINGRETKVCYTTGLHAVDLRDYPDATLRGVQPIEIRLKFLNTEGEVTLDELRLVEQLTPEEQAGLIPVGLDPRLETLEPMPYHGLEALKTRGPSPADVAVPNEGAIFHDTSTGAEIWKLTGSARGEFWTSSEQFSSDGSAILVNGRSTQASVIYDFEQGTLRQLPNVFGNVVFSRETPGLLYVLQKSLSPSSIRYTVNVQNYRTGETSVIADWTNSDMNFSETYFWRSPYSDMLIIEQTQGRTVYLVNPREQDVQARVRRIELPLRMKGLRLTDEDRSLSFGRAWYFQRWLMDLDTEEIELQASPTYGGHGASGSDVELGRYGTMMLVHKAGLLPIDEAAADEVRIWSNWAAPIPSDYATLTPDDRWLVTNGTGDAVKDKRLLIDGNETGTVMQIVHDFLTRTGWDSGAYTKISPDATKLGFNTNMFGDVDVCVAITRRPEAPRNLRATQQDAGVLLEWEAPTVAAELRGYNIYRSETSGRGYQRINPSLVTELQYVDEDAPDNACYAVVAEEHSGLEGLYSEEAIVGQPASYRIQAEIEEAELTPPMRQDFDGGCANFRYARIWQETAEETVGAAEFELNVPAAGQYTAWVRALGSGEVNLQVGDAACTATVDSGGWSWVKIEPAFELSRGKQTLTLTSESDGLCLDRLLLTSDPADTPASIDERDPKPNPVTGLQTVGNSINPLMLRWAASVAPDFDHYSLYVGDSEGFSPGNATLLASGRTAETWDWNFARGGTRYYKVVVTNKRGIDSEPATIRVRIP